MGILTTNDRVWVLMILLQPKHSLTNNCFIIILGAFILNPMQQVLHNFLHLPLDPLQGGKQSSYSPQQPFFAHCPPNPLPLPPPAPSPPTPHGHITTTTAGFSGRLSHHRSRLWLARCRLLKLKEDHPS